MSSSFRYRARDAAGVEQKGVLVGESPAAVARSLSGMGWVPLEVKADTAAPAGEGAAASTAVQIPGLPALSFRFKLGAGKRMQASLSLVMRELAALLRAGVPLMKALQLTAESCNETGVKAAMQRISRDLDNGHNLVTAAEREQVVSGLIGNYDVSMLQIGERTGRLPEAFLELHKHREFIRETNDQVSSALRYPSFVIATCFIALMVVNIWVIPSFAKVFAQARMELPALTLFLLGMSKFIKGWWYLVIGGVVGSGFAWTRWLSTDKGRTWWDRNKLRIPIVGPILEGIVLSRLSASLHSSISAGLTITDAITVSARTLDNRWFEIKLKQMCDELGRGTSISAAARNMGILPGTMVQIFAIGEESGQLDDLMHEISQHYKSEVDYATKRLSGALEPILIWFLGMGVLVLALGIFMPMWDMSRMVSR